MNDKIQMTKYSEKRISEYLNELSSKSPVPGGGSAAALVGAIGAALLNKVANFTTGKEKYKVVEEEINSILKHSEIIRKNFMDLCSEDIEAYKRLSSAFKMPRTRDRERKIQSALKGALAVPFEVCKNAHGAMKLCEPLVKSGNANLITDAGDGAIMLKCAFEAALLTVEINLKDIKDEALILETRNTLEPMKKEIEVIFKRVNGEVERNLRKRGMR